MYSRFFATVGSAASVLELVHGKSAVAGASVLEYPM
jgi:hypothetical protein